MRKTLKAFCQEENLDDLLSQWEAQLNLPLTPDAVSYGSKRKVWRQCQYGHVWKAVICSRTGSQKCDCPTCAGSICRKRRRGHADISLPPGEAI